MRFLVLALALLSLNGFSAHAQATGTCAAQYVGSPSCPYQWVGATSVAFTGNGNGLGFVGMTAQCRADFGPGARVCKSEDIMDSDTLNPNAIPGQGCWLRPSWRGFIPKANSNSEGIPLDESGFVGLSAGQLNCHNWELADIGFLGLTLLPTGVIRDQACNVARPASCCKPIAVGEPQASIMLPTGVGVLAMLSMMKGGA